MAILPKVKLKAVLSFPSAILDGAGIDVTRINGAFKLDLAFDDFAPPVSSVPDPSHTNALLWNSVTGAYVLAPITILGSGGAVPEAPNDGTQYARQSLNWTPVAGGSGGTTVLVSDMPPAGAADNSLWFESDTGALYIRYRDVDSAQWVAIDNSGGGSVGRTRLIADTTYNIPGDFSSVGAATDFLSKNVDGGGYSVTLQLADGTYLNPLFYIRPMPGIVRLTVQGNASDNTLVTLASSTGGSIVQLQDPLSSTIAFRNLRLDVSGCYTGVGAYQGNLIILEKIYWKGSGSNNVAFGGTGAASVVLIGNHSVESLGTSAVFVLAADNGFVSFEPSCTLTIVGTPAFAAFVVCERNGVVSFVNSTIVNGATATGPSYLLSSGAVLDLFGMTGTFPGGIVGVGDGSEVVRLAGGALSYPKPTSLTGTSSSVSAATVVYNASGPHTTTFPAASSNPGKIINAKNISAQAINSASSNIVPLTGGAAGTALLGNTAGKWATVQSDGSNWIIIAAN